MKTQTLVEYEANQLKISNIKEYREVYCVVDTLSGKRVSCWYTRAGDAKRKEKQLNGNWHSDQCVAVVYDLRNPEVIPE